MLNFSSWIKDHYIHTWVSEIVSLYKGRWPQLKADWSSLVLQCSNCAHQRLSINKRKTKTIKPDMLNHLHTETVSRSTIWAVAITGHDDFLFISFLCLPCLLPTLTFIYSISNCTTAFSCSMWNLWTWEVIGMAGNDRVSRLRSCRATVVKQCQKFRAWANCYPKHVNSGR